MLPLPEDMDEAHRIWTRWKPVLEFGGSPSTNPVISNSTCFDDFCHDFGIVRNIRAGRREDLRTFLHSEKFPLNACLADTLGESVDVQDFRLRRFFAPVGKNQSLRAALSKLFWALQPSIFTSYDNRTKLGFQTLSGAREFTSYVQFLDAFNALYRSIRSDLTSSCTQIDNVMPKIAFERLVLSIGLARIGKPRRTAHSLAAE